MNSLQPSIYLHIPKEQAAFRPGKSCDRQVLALTTFIESGFQTGLKTFVSFVDLSAAYDTVWREGLVLKLANIIPDRTLLNLVYRVYMLNGKSRWRRLNNGLPHGSVLSLVLYNIYTVDLPSTQSKKFLLADKTLAIQTQSFEAEERMLESDLNIIDQYYSDWRLEGNPSKTEVAAFHLK